MSAIVALEVYLGLSLPTLIFLFYKFYKLREEKVKLLEDASDISYWFIEHNYDLVNHYEQNGIREKTQHEIKSYDYLKTLEKAGNLFSGNNNDLGENYDFNEVFED